MQERFIKIVTDTVNPPLPNEKEQKIAVEKKRQEEINRLAAEALFYNKEDFDGTPLALYFSHPHEEMDFTNINILSDEPPSYIYKNLEDLKSVMSGVSLLLTDSPIRIVEKPIKRGGKGTTIAWHSVNKKNAGDYWASYLNRESIHGPLAPALYKEKQQKELLSKK